MSVIIDKCPACNEPIPAVSDTACPTCNWEFIIISDTASIELKKYFSEKLNKHKTEFETKIQNLLLIQSLSDETINLKSKVSNFENEILKYAELGNITDEFEKYKLTHPDSVILNSGTKAKEAYSIFWEQISPLNFRFYADNIERIFPAKIVLLLKIDDHPQTYGDCDVSILIETKQKKKTSDNVIELSIPNQFVKEGTYFSRFINLNYQSKNIFFFHKEQAQGNNNFKSKTIIKF